MDLLGPDISNESPIEAIEEVGDRDDVFCRQFVNRWVFLPHQRAAALRELQDRIRELKVPQRIRATYEALK